MRIQQMFLHSFGSTKCLCAIWTPHVGGLMHTLDMFIQMPTSVKGFETLVALESFLLDRFVVISIMHTFDMQL